MNTATRVADSPTLEELNERTERTRRIHDKLSLDHSAGADQIGTHVQGTARYQKDTARFRRKAFAMLSKELTRSIVNDASQSAAAGIDTKSSNSIFDSASQTLRLRTHSDIALMASA